jgi:peptidyl-prolyl cis-trans isomerase A (cyclophilin A)
MMIRAVLMISLSTTMWLGMAGGCAAPQLSELLGNIRLDQLAALLANETLNDAQRAERLRQLGISDELLIELLLSLDGIEVEEEEDEEVPDESSRVLLQTTLGDIVLELNDTKAPITVANFLQYVEDGYYDGDDGEGATIFHRVISGFVVQGGGFTETMQEKPPRPPIASEADNGLTNDRGTVSMALTGSNANSATSQFFINVVDNDFLNIGVDDPPGFTVFGRVVQGMGIVDTIAEVATDENDAPLTPIVIDSATVVP